MEKKKTTTKKPAAEKAADKPETGAAAEEKAEKPKKKAAPRKTTKKKEDLGIKRAAPEKRAVQEKDSIAPPTEHLVDPFAKMRGSRSSHQAPAITRLAAGQSLPRPPAPPVPAAKLATQPAPAASAAAPAAPPASRPAVPPSPATPPKPTMPTASPAAPAPRVGAPVPAKPAVPGAPAARPATPGAAPAKPAVPGAAQPIARTGLPAAPRPAVPGAPVARPGVPPARPGAPAQPGARPPMPPRQQPRPQPKPKPAPKPVAAPAPAAPAKPSLTPLQVSTQTTVRELGEKMSIAVPQVIKKLMQMGVFATINQRLEPDVAVLVAHDFGFDLQVQALHMEEELAASTQEQEKPENLKPRSAVVTIMGHVDHGKTSLLDAIRQANVAEGEAGGITQHIGAYKVKVAKGELVFLDTPGHEAFTAMRARGAQATDIVVLVVSAADGVMPQTVEAIDHAKAAGVPIVVAVNKIDLPTANPQKIRQELAQYGLQPEDWGGKNIFVDVSAKKRLNLEKLLEMLLLQAEMMELKANPGRPAQGVVLEARMDQRRGAMATVLIQNGTAKVGDPFVAGLGFGKVKAMITDRGDRMPAAGPSTPVELLGFSGDVPQAGDVFNVVSNERQAREIAEKRGLRAREESLAHKKHMSLVGLRAQAGGGKAKKLAIVLKADAQGSVQAIKDSLEKLSNAEIAVQCIHAGTGNLNESDVLLAGASDAVMMLFHVTADAGAETLAARDELEVRKYEIIYELIADVKAAMEGLLEPEIVDVVIGKAEVREIFNARGTKVAGCMVVDGKVLRGGSVAIYRGGLRLAEAKIASLKRFKDDAREVEKGLDCGIMLEGYQDFQKGDRLDAIVKEKRTRRLEAAKQQ